jgi:putative resolvase
MDEYVSTKEARKILGVTTQTLINWSKTGKIGIVKSPSDTRLYSKQDIYNIVGSNKVIKEKLKICYCRVSSRKQMDDLERQQDFFRSKYPNHHLVTDIGSGINWKRKGLQTVLEQSMSGTVSEVVVAHRDRLCRFAFELIEFILTKNNVKLIVLDDDTSKSKDSELSDDILSIIHIYSCRNMGRRRYSNQIKKTENISNKKTETDIC